MSRTAKTAFRCESWSEETIDETEGLAKMTRASSKQTYSGDLEGESVLEYLMGYEEGGAARFVGLERVTGTLHGKRGSFLFRLHGTYSDGVARVHGTVVEDSGSGELEGLSGAFRIETPHAESYAVELDYELG